MHQGPTAQRGFTLIELSIVLVVIGLVVGGVLVGQDLLKAAAMRKTVSELEKFQTAVATFQLKYNGLPGDLVNAVSLLGADNTGCPANYDYGTATGTCNGDGNGLINGYSTAGNVENIYVWEDLSLAGLISPIAVNGLVQPGTGFPLPKGGAIWIQTYIGLNMPASAFSSTIGYNLMSADPSLISFGYYPPAVTSGQLMIEIGGNSNQNMLWGGGFTAPQARQLDIKIDDGLPNTGRVSAINPQAAGTSNPNMTCLSGSAYSSSDTTGCVVYFLMKL